MAIKKQQILSARRIVKESLKILIVASIISSLGGVGWENFKLKIATLVPLLIMLPALNDMIGDFGTIFSSKFTTLLYQKKVPKIWWHSHELGDQFRIIATISLFAALYLGIVSLLLAYFQGFPINIVESLKVIAVAFLATTALILVVFLVAVIGGFWVYKNRADPNNFLIPLTTAIGDFASLILLSLMVAYFF